MRGGVKMPPLYTFALFAFYDVCTYVHYSPISWVHFKIPLWQWLFYQASTHGPYFGQIEYWARLTKVPNSAASAHDSAIASRAVDYLNERLKDKNISAGIHILSLILRFSLGCAYMTTVAYHLKMPETCRAGMMLFWKETARRKRLVFSMRFHPRAIAR